MRIKCSQRTLSLAAEWRRVSRFRGQEKDEKSAVVAGSTPWLPRRWLVSMLPRRRVGSPRPKCNAEPKSCLWLSREDAPKGSGPHVGVRSLAKFVPEVGSFGFPSQFNSCFG